VAEDAVIVDCDRVFPALARIFIGRAESSLEPGFWLKVERSEEDDEEVVEIEAAAG
jgi:hypothetical protein